MGTIAKTDAELVEASRRGERDAFGQLVTRYQDVVCAVSYSSTGSWALSEDVAQDTFIAAWGQLGQLREPGRLRAWLCGIARNLARKARRRAEREEVVDPALPAATANPFDATAQAEVDRVVAEALARVPDTYRETLVLYYCENRSIREVAEALEIAEGAAMQRLTRGRRYLADGVNELVERSLRGARRKDLRLGVVAALPTLPSRVDSPKPEGSNMWKLGIAAVVATAVVTPIVIVTREPAKAHVATAGSPESAVPTSSAQKTAPAATHAAQAPAMSPATVAQANRMAAPVLPTITKDTIKRLELDKGPSRGPVDAPVEIILFQDLMCTYCGTVLGTIDQLWDEYPKKLRLVMKQFPVHREARLAAEASLAADAQGKFWELHDAMIAHQDDLSRDAIVALGKQVGMDPSALAAALDQHTYAGAVAKEMEAASEIGVRATPQFLVNGEPVTGALPIESFRAAIDKALAAR